MTLTEIESLLQDQASKLDLSGVINSSIIKLLAYGIYIDNANLNSKLLNSLASSTTNTDAAISHAMQNLFSVNRGTNSSAKFYNIIANTTQTFNYLDQAFKYNGYYFYYNNSFSSSMGSTSNVDFIMSDRPLMSYTVSTLDDEYVYVDFPVQNVSESIILEGLNSNNEWDTLSWTNDAYEFFKDSKSNNKFVYDYLLITSIGYSVRLIRRTTDINGNASSWSYSQYRIRYIPYSEFVPDLTSLRSAGDWEYIETISDSASTSCSSIEITKFTRRLSNTEQIYSMSTKSYLSRGQIGSKSDIESLIENTLSNFSGNDNYIDTYFVTSDSGSGYVVYIKGDETDVANVYDQISSRCPYAVKVKQMTVYNLQIKFVTNNNYYSDSELSKYFNNVYKNSRNIDLDILSAEILRYDPDMDKCVLTFIEPEEYRDQRIVNIDDNCYLNLELIKG